MISDWAVYGFTEAEIHAVDSALKFFKEGSMRVELRFERGITACSIQDLFLTEGYMVDVAMGKDLWMLLVRKPE